MYLQKKTRYHTTYDGLVSMVMYAAATVAAQCVPMAKTKLEVERKKD